MVWFNFIELCCWGEVVIGFEVGMDLIYGLFYLVIWWFGMVYWGLVRFGNFFLNVVNWFGFREIYGLLVLYDVVGVIVVVLCVCVVCGCDGGRIDRLFVFVYVCILSVFRFVVFVWYFVWRGWRVCRGIFEIFGCGSCSGNSLWIIE